MEIICYFYWSTATYSIGNVRLFMFQKTCFKVFFSGSGFFPEIIFSNNHGSQNAAHGFVAKPFIHIPHTAASTTTAARAIAGSLRKYNKDWDLVRERTKFELSRRWNLRPNSCIDVCFPPFNLFSSLIVFLTQFFYFFFRVILPNQYFSPCARFNSPFIIFFCKYMTSNFKCSFEATTFTRAIINIKSHCCGLQVNPELSGVMDRPHFWLERCK